MTTVHNAVRLDRTTGSARFISRILSRILESGWGVFHGWWQRARMRAKPCVLNGREPTYIMTRGGVAYVASNRSIDLRGIGSHYRWVILAALLCIACIFLPGDASAQCTARDVLRNQLTLKKTPSAARPPVVVTSAAAVPVWKTITLGTFASWSALNGALAAAGCGIGNSAGEILARPAFTLSTVKRNVELLAVSAAELGFETDTASLADIYARARRLGFGLAAAEVAPQLRLQYFDQPIGEFLIVGMEPIKTWHGEPVILNVANGGAGLIIIGQDGSSDVQISVVSRFLFVRSNQSASANGSRATDVTAITEFPGLTAEID